MASLLFCRRGLVVVVVAAVPLLYDLDNRIRFRYSYTSGMYQFGGATVSGHIVVGMNPICCVHRNSAYVVFE